MTTPKPPREWWILRWSEDWLMNTLEEAKGLYKEFGAKEIVHVIEFSAFEQAIKERDEARVEIERLKISRYEEGRSSAAMDREEAIFSERKACALLAECEKALEFATENICRHTGELHPGNGREWCLACHSWVYKHDREGLELFDKTLTKLKARNTNE